MDWTPSAGDGKTFEAYIGKAISVVADVDYRALFIVQPITGQCKVVPMTEDFNLVKQGGSGSFDVRGPLDLLGMTKEHINKGEACSYYRILPVNSDENDCYSANISRGASGPRLEGSHSNDPFVSAH